MDLSKKVYINMDKEKKVYNIGILIGNAHTSHPKQLIRGISEGAKEHPCNLFFFLGTQSGTFSQDIYGYRVGDDYDYQFNVIYDYAILGNLDVLIISYGTLCAFLENQNKEKFFRRFQGLRYIVLEELDERKNGNYIISDNIVGMSNVVEHLVVHHKYNKILYVSGPTGNTDASERKEAFMHMMEKHGIAVDDTMIALGDYSEYVDEKIGKLLDAHPDAQAIVCANDEMAVSAYRECKRRRMIVGKDIAVTGYDNFFKAPTMIPPLTTAEQNGYDMGYRALFDAIRICDGEECLQTRLPAKLKKRHSCGCVGNDYNIKVDFQNEKETYFYIEEKVDDFISGCILAAENEALAGYMRIQIRKLILFIVNYFICLRENHNVKCDVHGVDEILNQIINGEYRDFISTFSLMGMLSSFLKELTDMEKDVEKKLQIMELRLIIQNNLFTKLYVKEESEHIEFRRKALMGPLFERKILECINNEQEVFYQAALQLKNKNIPMAYIYVFDSPVIHRKGNQWKTPGIMYLASYCANDKVVSFETNERPTVDWKKGFSDFLPREDGHILISFILYSEEKQYGLMMCEIDISEITSMYVTSLQLGNIMRFLEMSKFERKIQRKLEDKVKIIQEKNEVLNFVSEYDQMTGILNRRGFGENALRLNRRNRGKRAYFLFADLDHLKEINDCFGHSEGDYAIIKVAQILKQSIGNEGVAGRLGGDEFVAMIVSDEEGFECKLLEELRRDMFEMNHDSGKPYYIEFSVGIIAFTCNDKFDLSNILKEADKALYEAKRSRRASIVKKIVLKH